MSGGPWDEYAEKAPWEEYGAAPEPKQGAIRKIADLGAGFASGAIGATKAVADAAGAGNAVSGVLDSADKKVQGWLSPQAQADQQEQQDILREADGKGILEGIKAGGKAFMVAPVQTAVQGLGSVVPTIAAAALTRGASVPASFAAMGGIGAAQGAGSIKGGIYDDIKERSAKAGIDPAIAEANALKAQEYGGPNTAQIVLGGALGAADALTGVDKIAGTMLRKKGAEELVKGSERGIVGRAIEGAVGEMPLEAAQGGQQQYATNVASQREGFAVDPMDGVVSQGVFEGLASAGPGAAFGAAHKAKPAGMLEQAVGTVAPPETVVRTDATVVRTGETAAPEAQTGAPYANTGVEAATPKSNENKDLRQETPPQAAAPVPVVGPLSAAAATVAPQAADATPFPFSDKTAAQKQADARTREAGQPFEVADHPTVPDRFAVLPARLEEPKAGKPDADGVVPAPAVAPVQPVAATGPFATIEQADDYISNQKRAGSQVSGLPVPMADGTFGLATKGTPEYETALTLREMRAQQPDLFSKEKPTDAPAEKAAPPVAVQAEAQGQQQAAAAVPAEVAVSVPGEAIATTQALGLQESSNPAPQPEIPTQAAPVAQLPAGGVAPEVLSQSSAIPPAGASAPQVAAERPSEAPAPALAPRQESPLQAPQVVASEAVASAQESPSASPVGASTVSTPEGTINAPQTQSQAAPAEIAAVPADGSPAVEAVAQGPGAAGVSGAGADGNNALSESARFEGIKATPSGQRTDADVQWANDYLKRRDQPAQAAQAEAERVQEEAAKNIDGFKADQPPMVLARVTNALNQQVMNGGRLISRKELVRERIADGATVQTVNGERRLIGKDGAFQAEKQISKTGMDYAEHLLAVKQAAAPTEASATPESPTFTNRFAAAKYARENGITALPVEVPGKGFVLETKPAHEMSEAEFGSVRQAEAIQNAEQELEKAKAGKIGTGAFTGFKSKADAVRQLTAQLEKTRTAKPETFASDHLAEINKAIREGKTPSAENVARYQLAPTTPAAASPAQPGLEKMQQAKAAREEVATPAVHQDPGQPAETATAPVIAESMKTAAKAVARTPAQMKTDLVAQIDAATAKAPAARKDIGTTEAKKSGGKLQFSGVMGEGDSRVIVSVRQGSDDNWHVADSGLNSLQQARHPIEVFKASGAAAARAHVEALMPRLKREDGKFVVQPADMVTFDIPGDGKFTVLNTPERLEQFRAKVERSPGFSNKATPKPEQSRTNGYGMRKEPGSAFGVESGSENARAAVANMIEEGDLQAALEYATVKKVDLSALKLSKEDRAKLDAWLKDNPQVKTKETDKGTALYTTLNAKAQLAGTKYGKGIASIAQAKADAAEVMGFDSGISVLTESLPDKPTTPMRYVLGDRTIRYNTAVRRSRAANAEYMIEEVLHALDHVGGDNTISASNARFLPGGDLRSELEQARNRSAAMKEFLAHPLDEDYTDGVKAAELFARAGTLYFVQPKLLQLTAPTTYEHFRKAFGLPASSAGVQGSVQRDATGRPDQGNNTPGSVGAAAADTGNAAGSRQGGAAELQRLREAVLREFGGRAEGARVDFGSASSSLNAASRDTLKSIGLKDAQTTLSDLFRVNVPGKLNWWHKTVGTMQNLALRSPEFKAVYDSVQNFINDVSFYATESANLAPTILPKLETWKDIAKSPLSPQDTKALSAPVFEGTLSWTRDARGKPVPEADPHKAGIVWSDEELADKFKLSEKQIALYREFRTATDKSLTHLAVSDMLRFAGKDAQPIKDTVMASASVTEAADTLTKYLRAAAKEEPARADVLNDSAEKVEAKAARAMDLMARGYAPLSRFGHYTLDVTDKGERVYFGMFESPADVRKMTSQLKASFPEAELTQGTVSEEAYKIFAGVTPETVELFGDLLGLEAQGDSQAAQAFQQYLKLARSNRSAMKRLIERKGIAGFSEDAGRVLAGFVYSNARQTAQNLHMGEMTQGLMTMKEGKGKQEGELFDTAAKLVDYIKNPREEAQKVRGLLFAQYIGGSVASAAVNLTQPITMTLPWLSQYGGIGQAGKQMTSAVKDALKFRTGDAELDAAIKQAEEEGIVSPQEVHQLMAQAQGKGALKAGDGTPLGNATAKASNALSKLQLVWGKVFSAAEQFNRRVTFIAAWRTAKDQGMANPAAFAAQAIAETQGVYNKGNKPEWARGAVGSTLFTFRQYSISYVEMLHRMATRGGPEGKKAALLSLGILFLMSGAGGLPGADDLDDILSGALQTLGYNFDSKSARKAFLAGILGDGGAQFVERGISGLGGVPIDVSGRLGMGNLIPGTGLLTKKTDHTRDVAELAGPAGDLAARAFQAGGKLLKGEIAAGANTIAPKAIQNLTQAYDMASMGMYRDQSGKKVIDTDGADALSKALGFQPNDVKQVQDATGEVMRRVGLNKMRETEIADEWAQGMFEKDADKVQAARDALASWNEANPESPIRIDFRQIIRRVRSMGEDKATRIARTAPREIRASVRRELESTR